MGRTKKIGSAGKFGTRYGMRLRRKWVEIDRKQRLRHICPVCQRHAVRRIASGIWKCRKCGAKFTGGAYVPQTPAALTVERAVKKARGE
ncbi:50S ribosomal protein L37ae [Candidatus Pyrohabitans sp.]